SIVAACQRMNAATYRLKMAPTSAPSMTPIPTARPASMTRRQRPRGEVSINAASARKLIATVRTCAPNPQQAVEKKVEFNAAAIAPRKHAGEARPALRKKHHAASPSTSTEAGV